MRPEEQLTVNILHDFETMPPGISSYDEKGPSEQDYWGIISDPTGNSRGNVVSAGAIHNDGPAESPAGYRKCMKAGLEFKYINNNPVVEYFSVEFDSYIRTKDEDPLRLHKDHLSFQVRTDVLDCWKTISPEEHPSTSLWYKTEGWKHFTYDLTQIAEWGAPQHPVLYMRILFSSDGDCTPADSEHGVYIDDLQINKTG
jgi:hypothetical protein